MQRIKFWAKMSKKAHTLALHCVKMAIDFENRFRKAMRLGLKKTWRHVWGQMDFFGPR